MKVVFGIIVGVPLFLTAIFGLNYYAYGTFNFFAPKYEATRRDVMIESRAYSEATIRELYNLKLQYQQARTDPERETIAALARHEFSIFPKERLPLDLQAFMSQVNQGG